MIKLNNGNFYTGITNDILNRLKNHISGNGSKCVRTSLPFELIYVENVKNRSEASKREYQIKKLRKKEKIELLNVNYNKVCEWK